VQRLERVDCNARTHLLLSQFFWAVVWIKRYHIDDHTRLADHLLDIFENGLSRKERSWRPQALAGIERAPSDKAAAARETFLQSATALVNEQGYLGASVQKIAERLNLSKGSFYYHVEAKDDLILACFQRTLDIMRHAQVEASRSTRDGCANLVSAAAALVEYQLSGNAPLLRTSALTSVPEEIHKKLIEDFERISGRFSLVASDGIADGSLRPIDANIAAQAVTAMVNASAEVHMWAPGIKAETVARVYVRPLFHGLLSP
jgi:AcrR family transcriptional regulator